MATDAARALNAARERIERCKARRNLEPALAAVAEEGGWISGLGWKSLQGQTVMICFCHPIFSNYKTDFVVPISFLNLCWISIHYWSMCRSLLDRPAQPVPVVLFLYVSVHVVAWFGVAY